MDSDFYARALASAAPATTDGGASSFFSHPETRLDPHLFDGMEMKPDVRHWVRQTLYKELTKLGLRAPGSWAFVWVAGSGVSYQWAASRGNGDLDVLFGVDMPMLVQRNPDWAGMPEDQFAGWLNGVLKSDLWPRTAHHDIHGQVYEVTFYLNPGTRDDITAIQPYAAYRVTNPSGWTVRPDPAPPSEFPGAWQEAANHDALEGQYLVHRHNALLAQLGSEVPGSARWHNLGTSARLVGDQAKAMFDEIHNGRHAAFAPGGHGYRDWHNYRWQAAKGNGVISGLNGILTARSAANDAAETELYGGHVSSAEESLSLAQMVARNRPGMPR